jgi:hypothetical protein
MCAIEVESGHKLARREAFVANARLLWQILRENVLARAMSAYPITSPIKLIDPAGGLLAIAPF